MDETDKKLAGETWEKLSILKIADMCIPDEKTLAIQTLAAALAKARQEGRREGIEAMRDEAVTIVLRRYEVSVCEPAINTAAARLLAEGEKE